MPFGHFFSREERRPCRKEKHAFFKVLTNCVSSFLLRRFCANIHLGEAKDSQSFSFEGGDKLNITKSLFQR